MPLEKHIGICCALDKVEGNGEEWLSKHKTKRIVMEEGRYGSRTVLPDVVMRGFGKPSSAFNQATVFVVFYRHLFHEYKTYIFMLINS